MFFYPCLVVLEATKPHSPSYALVPLSQLHPRGSEGSVAHVDLFPHPMPEAGKNGRDITSCCDLFKCWIFGGLLPPENTVQSLTLESTLKSCGLKL